MYMDSSGALQLLQLLLNPTLTAGLQAAANPNNGLFSAPPPRQAGGSQAMVAPGTMTMANMPPVPYAPWLFSAPLPAVPNTMNGPVYVPSSVWPSLQQQQQQQQQQQASLSALNEAIAPYGAPSASTTGTSSITADDSASPMPMATLLSVLAGMASGARVVLVNLVASVAVMFAARLGRLVLQNLPIILNVLGLTRATVARLIVDGVTRAQCLERAACLLGRHASTYSSTPELLRWLRSPDPNALEHPVWGAFRTAAEGYPMQCETLTC